MIHLHNHSFYSLMDGFNSPAEIVQRAVELKQSAVAITDHGTLAGHRELQVAAKEAGIKPILGLEAYFSPTDRFDKSGSKDKDVSVYNHVILLAKDQQGLNNLNALSKNAYEEGYYFKPRIDRETLSKYKEGLIVLSGCMSGVIAKAWERTQPEAVEYWMKYFTETFGDDFYMEVQPHNPPELNAALLQYAEQYNVTPVVTSDSHFAYEKDRDIEDIMLILSTGAKRDTEQDYESTKGLDIFERLSSLYPDRPISFEHIDVFMTSEEEMRARMLDANLPLEALRATQEIESKICGYELPEGLNLLPRPRSEDPLARLSKMAFKGLKTRGIDTAEYRTRLREELSVIEEKDFASYFLIVSNAINWARSKDIMVGPGRGSGAGSLLNYALKITDVDPIKYDLLFARFLDPSRNDLPDIDMDFGDKRRNEVKEYIRKQFGYVSNIATYTPFKDKNVIKDIARVLAVPLKDVLATMKKVQSFEDYEQSKVPEVVEFKRKYPEVLEYASRLRGKIRQAGVHAAGVVVSKEPIENYAPIEYRKMTGSDERVPVTAYTMETLEEIGLIKFDFLGISDLTVLQDTQRLIKERHDVDVVFTDLDLADRKVFKMLSEGKTEGIFQAGAKPSTDLLKEMQVKNFNELVASNALVRPGAKETVGDIYLRRMRGEEKVSYIHPIMEKFTKDTYGVIIYQEQVMQACVNIGGLSWADANKIRKIIGKKQDPIEFDAYKTKFVEGASKKIDKKKAEALWHDFEAHAKYSFNLSHSVAYSMITYWAAWLKYYYPLEFMTCLLKNEANTDKITEYIIAAGKMGLEVKLPHVNTSEIGFSIQGDAIQFGLENIKNISETIAPRLIDLRPIEKYSDLVATAYEKGSGISSRVLSSLNAVGAAEFLDNPLKGNESDNYYEYLGIPKFGKIAIPEAMKDSFVNLEDYEETESVFVVGLVKKIKTGKGWSLVELLDETGTASVFDKEKTELVAGTQYVILISNKRIVSFCETADLENSSFGKIFTEDFEVPENNVYIISHKVVVTKKKDKMGRLTIANSDRKMKEVLLFPNDFTRLYTKLSPGTFQNIVFSMTKDGTYFITGVKQ